MTNPPADLHAVLEPLRHYAAGHATGNPQHFRDAFLATAHIEGLRDGQFVSWDLDAYCRHFTGAPAATEAEHRRTVDALNVHETVATAKMTLHHASAVFTDMFVLIRLAQGWRIANKVYHRDTERAFGDCA